MNGIHGATRVYAVIGDPIDHSLSPLIHNAAFAAAGIDAVYVSLPVRSGSVPAALAGMKALNIFGISVTMPHKTEVAQLADECSEDVVALNSANTVSLLPDGRLRADSFDGPGCVDGLRRAGADPEGKRCVILGAGGAGRAVALALRRSGAAMIGVVNRHDGRANEAIALAGPSGMRVSADAVSDAEIIINSTPIGMGSDHSLPCDASRIGPGQFVNDLIYHPADTALLRVARENGARTLNGLAMLIGQAGRQWQQWTGQPAPLDVMEAAVIAELARRDN